MAKDKLSPSEYNTFRQCLKKFKNKIISIECLIQECLKLFGQNFELAERFTLFIPRSSKEKYQKELQLFRQRITSSQQPEQIDAVTTQSKNICQSEDNTNESLPKKETNPKTTQPAGEKTSETDQNLLFSPSSYLIPQPLQNSHIQSNSNSTDNNNNNNNISIDKVSLNVDLNDDINSLEILPTVQSAKRKMSLSSDCVEERDQTSLKKVRLEALVERSTTLPNQARDIEIRSKTINTFGHSKSSPQKNKPITYDLITGQEIKKFRVRGSEHVKKPSNSPQTTTINLTNILTRESSLTKTKEVKISSSDEIVITDRKLPQSFPSSSSPLTSGRFSLLLFLSYLSSIQYIIQQLNINYI